MANGLNYGPQSYKILIKNEHLLPFGMTDKSTTKTIYSWAW